MSSDSEFNSDKNSISHTLNDDETEIKNTLSEDIDSVIDSNVNQEVF